MCTGRGRTGGGAPSHRSQCNPAGTGWRFLGPFAARPRIAAPDVDLLDRADGAALDQLDDAAVVVAGVNLRAHLRDPLVLRRRLGDQPGLVRRYASAASRSRRAGRLQRRQGGDGVRVVRRGDEDGVEPLLRSSRLRKSM